MKKRLAFISEHASPLAALGGVDSGGQNLYVDQVAKHLSMLGYEIDIFTRWDNHQLPKVINYQNGIRVIHIKAGPVQYIKKELLLSYMHEFTIEMLRFIEEEELTYKLIHANFFMSALVASEIKKELRIPFVVTFHALGKIRRMYQGDKDTFPDTRFTIEKEVCNSADQIIAECPQDKEDLMYHYHASQDKISIIPCGFDPNEVYPLDKHLAKITIGLDPHKKYILQLGRIVPRKGIDTVIASFAKLRKKTQGQVKLLIVGGESDEPNSSITPEIGRLQNIAKALHVATDVIFLGRRSREQLKYVYNAADIFISVPWYEPFGITPLEAMACGTPVIGSRVGGIKFSVIDGKTGFLVEPHDTEMLATKMQELLTNEKLGRSFSENSLKRVNEFFTWKTVASMLSTIYEKILYSQKLSVQQYNEQSDIVDRNFEVLITTVQRSQQKLRLSIVHTTRILYTCLQNDGKILICGNGGSATDAQHFAGELVGRFKIEDRLALPVLSLTADSSILTAIGNDYSFENIFARQVEAYGKPGDVLIAISTSGNSKNIINALKTAREKDLICIGFTGRSGGKMIDDCDISLVVPADQTSLIQEIHTHLIHSICELIEKQLFYSHEQSLSKSKKNINDTMPVAKNG